MKHMKLILLALGISLLGLILTFSGINNGSAFAYFSSTENLYGPGFGMYGMYGGLGRPYGL